VKENLSVGRPADRAIPFLTVCRHILAQLSNVVGGLNLGGWPIYAILLALALTVVYGDTVKLEGQRLRIASIGAPETDPKRAKCDYEIQLGLKSKAALVDLLDDGEPKVEWLGRNDVWGRPLALISVNGKDVG
jgi:hypothetical protein